MELLNCTIERITYKNEENGFSVLKVFQKGSRDLITVTGIFSGVHIGSVLEIKGEWKTDKKYGRQFVATEWSETVPATISGIEKYIGSGLIKGVGRKLAKRLVDHFGQDTISIIENSPERLKEVPGFNDQKIRTISESFASQKEIRNIVLFLQNCSVNTSLAARIYQEYGNDSIKIIQENPYRLADEIWGIGFRTSDIIADHLGFGKDRFFRLRSGIMYALNRISEEGHCFANREQILETASSILGTEDYNVSMTLDHMIFSQELIKEDDAIYLPPFFFSERGTAERLKTILHSPCQIKVCSIDNILMNIQNNNQIEYDEIQINAIRCALTNKVMVLTGGPGTGKTTTVLGIIKAFKECGCNIQLAAPTGKAAKRLSDVTGMSAKTIHRLLEYSPTDGYKKNENHLLKGDVIIIDECSMIDILLMYNLLKAIPDTMNVILVGDADQLPSVGAGNVFKDIINSNAVPVVKLERIFRQAESSKIITNAHRINKGLLPDLSISKESDFFFIEESNPEKAAEMNQNLCGERLPKRYHIDPVKEIQVLSPMQKGTAGTINLNMLLQKVLNKNTFSISHCGTEFKLHDKVMQLRNNYDKDIYNGDVGFIINIDTDNDSISVNFDGRIVQYTKDELDELTLSYAITVHKSQGGGATRSLVKS